MGCGFILTYKGVLALGQKTCHTTQKVIQISNQLVKLKVINPAFKKDFVSRRAEAIEFRHLALATRSYQTC